MSKRRRSAEADAHAKRARGHPRAPGRPREADWTLQSLLETSGLNGAFFELLDPLSQRALCCANAAFAQCLAGMRAPLPFPLPAFYGARVFGITFDSFCGIAMVQVYWRAQLGLALHYDHVARLRDLPTRSIQLLTKLNWAIRTNAIECTRHLMGWLDPYDGGSLSFEHARTPMLRMLAAAPTLQMHNMARHIMICQRWDVLVDFIESPPLDLDLKSFLMTLRCLLLKVRVSPFDRHGLLAAMKPYGKRVPEHNPAPLLLVLKGWLKEIADSDPPSDIGR